MFESVSSLFSAPYLFCCSNSYFSFSVTPAIFLFVSNVFSHRFLPFSFQIGVFRAGKVLLFFSWLSSSFHRFPLLSISKKLFFCSLLVWTLWRIPPMRCLISLDLSDLCFSVPSLRLEVQCDMIDSEINHILPAFSVLRRECGLQREPLLFSCAGYSPKYRRLCPCRDFRRGQVALCRDCLWQKDRGKG